MRVGRLLELRSGLPSFLSKLPVVYNLVSCRMVPGSLIGLASKPTQATVNFD